MILRRSCLVHQLPVGQDRILIVHAVSHMRLPADREVDILLNYFAEPRRVPEDCAALMEIIPYSRDAIERAIAGLVERGVLTEKMPEEELAAIGAELAPTHGRDPGEILDHYRRQSQEGAKPYWAVSSAYDLNDLGTAAQRVDVLLFGDCDIQMEADFLRREATKRGIDLHVSATFPDDVRFASEHKHDAIFIGALRARHLIIDHHAPDKAHMPFTSRRRISY